MGLLASLIKSQKVVAVSPQTTVHEAAKTMTQAKVGSVVVMEGEKLVGIFSERDLLNRVVTPGLESKTTFSSQVMTKNPSTIESDDTVENCFKKMEQTRCRRLPIIDGKKVVGMVTMRNILEWIVSEMEEENIQMKRYIQS